jgi:hypothetical protein
MINKEQPKAKCMNFGGCLKVIYKDIKHHCICDRARILTKSQLRFDRITQADAGLGLIKGGTNRWLKKSEYY